MKVCVVGMGYIGLPTALMMAASGLEVIGTDYDESKIQRLTRGEITFEEKGLDALFARAVNGRISFSGSYPAADFYVVAVPTPYDALSRKIDPSYVVSAVNNVLDICGKGAIISIESTISPGTVDRFIRPILKQRGLEAGKDVHLAHTPERIIPGNMIYELEHNARTIGADLPEIGEKVKAVYASFCKGEIVITDIRTAEMTKVVENTFRDVNIAFANELAKICRQDNMDVYEIIRIANKHPRVNILTPGPGVGGHCISVDPWFLVGDYPNLANLIKQARLINDGMPEYVLERTRQIMVEHGLKDYNRIGFYGLTYKENVDDVRESPTLQLLESMKRHLAPPPRVYDPYVKQDLTERQYHDPDAFLKDVDLVVVMVGHDELKDLLPKLRDKLILDTRNVCGDGEGIYKL